MNAQTLSKKLKDAGFTRSTWSSVKGRGRSRRSNGFEIVTNNAGNLEVSIKDHRTETETQITSLIATLGLTEIAIRGSVHIYSTN